MKTPLLSLLLLLALTAPARAQVWVPDRGVGERAGLVVMGNDYTYISLEKAAGGNRVAVYEWKRAAQRFLPPREVAGVDTDTNTVWLGVRVGGDATYAYTYSFDGRQSKEIGSRYKAEPGGWIGAKAGLFCLTPGIISAKGYADFDFFRVE